MVAAFQVSLSYVLDNNENSSASYFFLSQKSKQEILLFAVY